MSDKSFAKMVFDKWSAQFSTKSSAEKSKEHYLQNFEELFAEMHQLDIPFETAYQYLTDACRVHYPKVDTIKYLYRGSPGIRKIYASESDFSSSWKELIKAKAIEAFHNYYPIGGKENTKKVTEIPSGMSYEEYRKQLKYAASFPEVDLSKIADRIIEDDELE